MKGSLTPGVKTVVTNLTNAQIRLAAGATSWGPYTSPSFTPAFDAKGLVGVCLSSIADTYNDVPQVPFQKI